jgi:hypothetical protein
MKWVYEMHSTLTNILNAADTVTCLVTQQQLERYRVELEMTPLTVEFRSVYKKTQSRI